jgi:exodeoxyribonuclease VII large subunit
MSTISLFQLMEHVRRALALNFGEPVWISAEIAQLGLSRGHRYLDLVQKGDKDEPIAKVQAVLWEKDYLRLRRQLGEDLDALMQTDLEVRLLVRVDFHERYGLKLVVQDVDTAHALGQLAAVRRMVLDTLSKEGLLHLNRRLPLPTVLQRIAVISAASAAGYRDFEAQLAENQFGYHFSCVLHPAAMQGHAVGPEVEAAMRAIARRADAFDAVVLIRGGGARLDLAGFDGLDLCRHAARLPLPLMTGLGHETDQTVMDLVAHSAHKTPTAVAAFLIQHNLNFEMQAISLVEQVRRLARLQGQVHQNRLERQAYGLSSGRLMRMQTAHARLDRMFEKLQAGWKETLSRADSNLNALDQVAAVLNPESVLRRGYSITYHNGVALRSHTRIAVGDILKTRLSDGLIASIVHHDD